MGIVDRRAKDKPVGFLCFCNEGIDRITGEDTSFFRTFSAVDAILYGPSPDLKQLRFDAFCLEGFCRFLKSQCRIAILMMTAILQQDFHMISPLDRKNCHSLCSSL